LLVNYYHDASNWPFFDRISETKKIIEEKNKERFSSSRHQITKDFSLFIREKKTKLKFRFFCCWLMFALVFLNPHCRNDLQQCRQEVLWSKAIGFFYLHGLTMAYRLVSLRAIKISCKSHMNSICTVSSFDEKQNTQKKENYYKWTIDVIESIYLLFIPSSWIFVCSFGSVEKIWKLLDGNKWCRVTRYRGH